MKLATVKLALFVILSMATQSTMAVFQNGSDTLRAGDKLTTSQYMRSANGSYRLYLQADGNVVLRDAANKALWASNTNGKSGVALNMQTDGNMVLRTSSGSTVWASGTNGKGANRAVMQNDGNFALLNSSNVIVWSTGTGQSVADTTRPVITLMGSSSMTVMRGSVFSDPGATASDNVDGNITSRIIKSGSVNTGTVGTYTLRYDVKDNAGNAATTVSRTINVTYSVSDTTRPVITLIGSSIMSITRGSTFSEPGATAFDNVDGNITNRIVKTGSVNTSTVGTYTLSYNVRDTAGNTATTVSRSVSVVSGTSTPPSQVIKLPIEVMGPAGTRVSVKFTLNDITGITHLYLRCNACGYHDLALDKNTSKTKATVRVNNSSAIPLKHFTEKGTVYGNRQIRIIGGEASYGGIGGGFKTVRMIVPVSGLVRGENTLTFEHLNAEAPSIGFRIIDLNLLQNGDLNRKVLSENAFFDDDPNNWSPPRNTSSDIAQGSSLWRQRDRLYDPWLDTIDGSANGRMRASCADCHATDGRDLKYFNFSNHSIVQRSRFHGMSQEEGEKIASYIRSLNIPIVDEARPWNPTYQPGPGLDTRRAYEWAAGAGVDAILDADRDMAPYLFPNGTSLDAVRQVVDRYDTLNFRELRVNIPMPEWNQWLPIIHPDDAFNTSASAILSDESGRNVGMPFYKKLFNDAQSNPTPSSIGALASRTKSWLRRGLTCMSNGPGDGEPMRALNGAVMSSLRLPSSSISSSNCSSASSDARKPYEIAKRGLTGWLSVKMWEIVHGNDLEQESMTMTGRICSAGRCIDASEPRGWVVSGRNVFDRTPHFIAGRDRYFFNQNAMLGILESNSWYHLNMILNPGYRRTMPSHFAYTYSHVELLQFESGVNQGYRFWATMIKQRQLQTNGRYGVEEGLDLRTAQPYVYYGSARNTTRVDTQASVGQPLWGRLAQAMVEDFVEDANYATANDWASATQNRKVQSRESTNFSPCGTTCTFDLGEYQGRNTYRVIPKLRQIGVAESAIDDLIDWGKKTWPRGPWENLR